MSLEVSLAYSKRPSQTYVLPVERQREHSQAFIVGSAAKEISQYSRLLTSGLHRRQTRY
jgi:hypothetical protein